MLVQPKLGLSVAICVGIAALVWSGSAGAHGDAHDRIQALTERIAGGEPVADLYLQRAGLLLQHGEALAALEDLDRATDRGSTDPSLDIVRSRALAAMGRTADARAVLDAMIAAHPDDVRGYLARAERLSAEGAHLAAAADLSRVVELSPRPSPDVFAALARCLERGGQWERALGVLDEGARRTAAAVTLRTLSADLAQSHGDTDRALANVDAILPAVGRKETWLLRRAEILAAAGRGEEAAASARGALAAVGRLPPALRDTGAMRNVRERAERLAAAPGSEGGPRE